MSKRFNQILASAIALLMLACNSGSTDTTSAETASTKDSISFDLSNAKSIIEAENTKFIDAIKRGDSSAVASNYSQDAWILPPNSDVVKGNNIPGFWGTFVRMGVKDLKLIIDDISGNEDQIAETGKYEIYGAENKLLDKGKYVVVWKPVNGSWKMYRDIFNTSMPATPAK
jgi:ketosteroid isomerase-like protein